MAIDNSISPQEFGIKKGLIAGIICLVITTLLYVIDKELVLSFWIYLGYLSIIVIMFWTGLSLYNLKGYEYKFADGLKSVFLVSAVALFIWIVFNSLLFKYIDPELIELSREKAVERTRIFMDSYQEVAGSSEESIEDLLTEVNEQDYSPSLKKASLNFASSCFIGFLFSLIISGLFHILGNSQRDQKSTVLQE